MGDSDDAEAVVRAIDEIGIDRLTETIVTAWEASAAASNRDRPGRKTKPYVGSN